eukprot:7854319-Alexandrium_andersonii.AAC.1
MSASLVGSEMCIRDRALPAPPAHPLPQALPSAATPGGRQGPREEPRQAVSYTHLTLPTICSV